MRYALLLFLVTVTVISCTRDDDAFFSKGRRVETGLIWEKSPVTAEKILDGKKKTLIFSDDFNRTELGPHWQKQGGEWRIEEGAVYSPTAHNRNLVLTAVALPENALIELTLWSRSPFVDVKFNAWGDGNIHDHGDGYSFILGGWKNRVSVIARLDEHEKNRVEDRTTRLQPNERYRITVIRLGKKIWWFVNDDIFLAYHDPKPLSANTGYRYFSFANWESEAFFDDIRIFSLE